MAYCPNCQESRPDAGKFCAKCGTQLVVPVGAPAGAAAPPPPPPPQQAPPQYAPPQYAPPAYGYAQPPSLFANLTVGLWIAAIGGAVAAIFTLVQWIQMMSQLRGAPSEVATPIHTVCAFVMALSIVSTLLALKAGALSGRGRTIRDGIILGLSGGWVVMTALVLILAAVTQASMTGSFDMGLFILVGGIAQAVGAMVDLVKNA